MAKVLVSLQQEDVRKRAVESLAENSRYQVVELELPSPGEGLEEITAAVAREEADVVVVDYWPEDAASVKLMQTVADSADKPLFIFVEAGQPAEREQILMALNEGAEAFLPHDFQASALVNYVERAVSGPGRLRPRVRETYGSEAAFNQLEEQLGHIRSRTGGFQKLVAYLLAAPPSVQVRKTLVVSDSSYQLELLRKILDDHNFPVLTASRVEDGLNLALSEKPRIIVSDLELDGQSGLDFCRAVKFTHKIGPCYFIICTANQDKIAKVMTPGNGVDDCLIKPSSQRDTVDFVSRVAMGLLL